MEKKLVVANWKMNPTTLAEAKKLFKNILEPARKFRNVRTVICPPFVYIPQLRNFYGGTQVALGAQDVSREEKGAHTGDVSASMLASVGVSHVIVGHSERRKRGETNEDIEQKTAAALAEGLTVLLCIGEETRDAHGDYFSFVRDELTSALANVQKRDLERVIIVYEPIWAIGKTDKDALGPEGMHEMSLFIRKILVERYERTLAQTVPILYGGSVERGNALALLVGGAVEGFLVGHASLDEVEFVEILTSANRKDYATT